MMLLSDIVLYSVLFLALIALSLFIVLLAHRTNGRAYATVLRLSVRLSVRLWCYVLWLNGAS